MSFSKSEIAAFWKTHSCKLIPNWTRKTVWLPIRNGNNYSIVLNLRKANNRISVTWNALVLLFHKFCKITIVSVKMEEKTSKTWRVCSWTNKITWPLPIGPQIFYSPNRHCKKKKKKKTRPHFSNLWLLLVYKNIEADIFEILRIILRINPRLRFLKRIDIILCVEASV